MSTLRLGVDEYKREIDIMKGYQESLAIYASVMKGISKEEALEKAVELTKPGGPLEPMDPDTTFLFRPKAQHDRVIKKAPFSRVIKHITDNNLILSPSLVAYERPEVSESMIRKTTVVNLEDRYRIKEEGQIAKARGDETAAIFKGGAQMNKKTANNSFSGSNVNPHNPYFAPTLHTSLTANCRAGTSGSNSGIERFIAGNRHYYNKNITLENLVACIRLTDPMIIKKAIEEYNLEVPDADYVTSRVLDNCSKYWKSESGYETVRTFIRNCTELQRAAIIFSSDFRSFIETNDSFARTLVKECILDGFDYESIPMTYEQSLEVIDNCDGYLESFCGTLSSDDMRGLTIGDAKKVHKDIAIRFARQIVRVTELLTGKYHTLVRAFFITELMPHSIYAIPLSVREVVIGSDTDSTMFTMQTMIEWYFGELTFGYKADTVREFFSYFNAQLVCHYLAQVSRHSGVDNDDMFKNKMKPEFTFLVAGFTNYAKHYYTITTMEEGKVYAEPELGTKGVGLKNSKVPRFIIDCLEEYISWMSDVAVKGEKLTPLEVIAPVAYLEHCFIKALKEKKTTFTYNARIKEHGSYSDPEANSGIKAYNLWNQVFSNKYGDMGEFPIECKKIPVKLGSKSLINTWMNNVDPSIASAMQSYLNNSKENKRELLLVPQAYLKSNPLPEEIWMVMNYEKLLSGITAPFYMVLENSGIYYKNKNMTRFAFMEITMEEAKANCRMDIDKYAELIDQ